MSTPEQRAAFDDYEVKDEYDLTSGVRSRFYKSKKVSTTLRLDDDVLLYLKKRLENNTLVIRHSSIVCCENSSKPNSIKPPTNEF